MNDDKVDTNDIKRPFTRDIPTATPSYNIVYPEKTDNNDLYAGILLGVVLSFVLVALGIILGSVL